MKFNSQICTTKEQSERLLALGLKKETADMFYSHDKGEDIYAIRACWEDFWDSHKAIDGYIRRRCIPAWSLHRLIELAEVSVEVSGIWVKISGAYRYEEKDNAYDNLIDAIADLINNNVFNQEYLEK